MPAAPTSYERINVIVSRSLKRELVRQAKAGNTSLTYIMKSALNSWLNEPKKKRIKL